MQGAYIVIQKYYVREQTTLIKELCKDMEIEITGIETKLFSSYYSKVTHKMKIETGLPCGPQLGGGRRGALIQEDCLFDIMTQKVVCLFGRGVQICVGA